MEYGVIYDPAKDEMYAARRGGGAFCNGIPISVSGNDADHGIFLVGASPYYTELAEPTFRVARRLFDHCADFRRCGSAALDLCYVARGRGEMFFECKLSPWDYAAGSLLVEEAGGFTSDMEGKPLPITATSSVWACNQTCRHMLELVKGEL